MIGIGALLVAGGVALLLKNTVVLRSGAASTVRADDYLLRVVEVERLVVDAETGLRGYLVTGHPSFLQPLHTARENLPAAYAALRRAAADNHANDRQAADLIAAASAYLAGYVQDQLHRAAIDLGAARSVAMTQAGKRQVDAIRMRTAQLERLVAGRQLARQRAARTTADRSITEAIAVLVLLTGLTLLVGAYLGHLAVQRERARQRAASTTRTLQRSILPARIPPIPGCELAIRFLPEDRTLVGGDFCDVFEATPGSWALIVGDVCGKGAAAAAVTAMARWTLRTLLATAPCASDALRELNSVMLREHLGGDFITLTYMGVVINDDSAEVEVACAGHPAPVFVSPCGEPAAVDADGDLLGVWDDIRLRTARVRMSPGDSLVAYTDGVTDQGPEPAEPPELALRARSPGADAEQLAELVEALARPPAGRQRDDIAILALRFVGASAEKPRELASAVRIGR